jgi:hemoglobin-like flavoprotein
MSSIPELAVPPAELIRLIEAALRPDTRLAERFYAELFRLNPALAAQFPADMASQQQKFSQSLLAIVDVLQHCQSAPDDPRLAALMAELQRLGRRHLHYGACPADYALVGEALLAALQTGSASALPDQLRAAWLRLYGWISAQMLAGSIAPGE